MAEYPPPIDPTQVFNTDNWIPKPNTIDEAYLQANFCEYPIAQGLMNFSDVNVSGDTTVNKNLLLSGTPNVNYLEFPDGTQQFTASSIDANTVYNDISNTFLSPTTQTFQGSNSTTSTSAPIKFSNITSGEYGTLYVDPSPNNDLTLYSNQNNGGLTIRNLNGYSFTVNPTTGNVATFINPVSSTYRITGNGLTTTSNLIFPDGTTQTTAFTTSALSAYAPIASPVFTGNPQAPTPATTDNDTSIATTNYVKLNLNNYAPIASPVFTGNPTAPTPSITDNDTTIATTAFVQNNLVNYASLASPIFTGNPQAPTPATNDNDRTIATTAYVQANLLPLQGSLVSNTFTIFKGTINGSVVPNTYVYTGNKYVSVLINNLVFSMTSTYQFLQMTFTNDLYAPASLNATTFSVSGYLGTGSTLFAFTPYSTFINSNQITLAPSQNLSSGSTYSAELYFTFYFT
jgi:hypothetical protein